MRLSHASSLDLLKQDLQILYRMRSQWSIVIIFFFSVVALFAIALRQEATLYLQVLPTVIWVSLMLALILILEQSFKHDWQHGLWAQAVLSKHALSTIMACKILALWLSLGLPLLLCALGIACLFDLPTITVIALAQTLLLGTPILCALGSFAAALTVGLWRGGLLLTVLLLPLYLPVLILAVSALEAAALGLPYQGQLALLLAGVIICGTGTPLVTAAAVKVSVA